MTLTLSLLLVAGVADAQTYSIAVSTNSDRSDPVDLDGAVIEGDVYIFTTPDDNVDQVQFWFDDTTMTGPADKVENNGPYDWRGGTTTTPTAWDTSDEPDGEYTLSARILKVNNNIEFVHATFTIANDAPPPPQLSFSPGSVVEALDEDQQSSASVDLDTTDGSTATPTITESASWLTATANQTDTPITLDLDFDSTGLAPGLYDTTVTAEATGYPDETLQVSLVVNGAGGGGYAVKMSTVSNRDPAIDLDGLVVAGDIYVFTGPDTDIDRVRFFLDDAGLTGTPHRTENSGPFDYNGGSASAANPLDTTTLSEGVHTISAELLINNSTEVFHGTFTVANEAPPAPALVFSPGSVSQALEEDEQSSTSVSLDTSDGSTATPSITENVSWLTATADQTDTPITLDLDFDSTGLAPGTYTTTVTADAAGLDSASLAVSLTVNGPSLYAVRMSTVSDRSGDALLAGQVVQGEIYVFTGPDTDVDRVEFYLNDPSQSGAPHRTENSAPYDYNGGLANDANPLDTEDLSDGSHTISAELLFLDGTTEVVHATFSVANHAPILDFSPDGVDIVVEGDGVSAGSSSLSASDGSTASFSLTSSEAWLTVPVATGDTPATVDFDVDATGLDFGIYTGNIIASAAGYEDATLTVTLEVLQGNPTQIHLSWTDDPATTLTVIWHTNTTNPESVVEYREVGETEWQEASGGLRDSGTEGTLHEVTITGLTADTSYEYQVPGDVVNSDIYTTRTAPDTATADFDFIFFADTGLIGREDGLATGTEQVRDEIAAMNPLFVLAGGDYAYYNTDDRFPTLDDAIDAWFEQVEPIAAQFPMMPTYGNHEVFLGEGYEDWRDRFAVPDGFDGRRNYSFDIGDARIISVFGAQDLGGLRAGTTNWLEDEMAEAELDGKRWIIPFLHIAPFSDGSNHPSTIPLREELGPVLEDYDVHVVLTAHDQSFERTFPITGIPDNIVNTSESPDCYNLSDGITWVKVGPGGKLSNKNGDFSEWLNDPAPDWTATRNNTLHHFSHISVSADGELTVDTYGVVGDGTPITLVDSFRYTIDPCPGALRFDESELVFNLQEEEVASADVTLDTTNGEIADYTITSDATWLTVDPETGSTDQVVTVTADATGLTEGTYTGTLTAAALDFDSAVVDVTMTVSLDPYTIVFSTSSDRSDPTPLDGDNVVDDIYVFTTPDDSNVQNVEFYFDDPTGSGTPHRTENSAPYDFNGGQVGAANAYDTTDDPDGEHTISVRINLNDGGEFFATATFFITNIAPVLVATPGSVSLASDMDGPTVSDSVDLTSTGAAATWTADVPVGATWLTVTFDTDTTPSVVTFEADPTGLAPGDYSATVAFDSPDATSVNVDVDFEVIDNTPPLQFSSPSLDFMGDEDGAPPADQSVTLSALVGTASATITVPAGATWLTVTPTTGDTALSLDFSVDQTGLAAGAYQATVTASAPGYLDDTLVVGLVVEGSYEVAYSLDPDRSNAVNLAGQVVSGDIYVFSRPDEADIDNVEFWIDDPDRSGNSHRLENGAPYDLMGGAGGGLARPYDTTDLPDGAHDITALFTFLDGSEVVVNANFNILNNAPALDFDPGTHVFSFDPDDSGSLTVSITTTDASVTDFTLVEIVDEDWLTLTADDTTTPAEFLIEVDSAGLANGTYEVDLRATADGYVADTMSVEMRIGSTALDFFAGDDVHDTEISIDGVEWKINGELTYPGVTYLGNDIEGLLMNARFANAIFDDIDGDVPSELDPWDPRENTQDFIDNLEAMYDHGMRCFNVCMQGGRPRSFDPDQIENNPFGNTGTQCFDDWDDGLDTPESQYLVRLGSVIRAADDLGMAVEVGIFHSRQDEELDNRTAINAAVDGTVDWILEQGFTNVILEVCNEAGHSQFDHNVLSDRNEVIDLVERAQDRSDGPEGAHLPHGQLLVSVSDLGGRVPRDSWITTCDYVIYHGNGSDEAEVASDLDVILGRQVYEDNPKPLYCNEAGTRLDVLDEALDRHCSWGYYNANGYQDVFPGDDPDRWTLGIGQAWWDELAEITDSNP